jgi:hypothetical protein
MIILRCFYLVHKTYLFIKDTDPITLRQNLTDKIRLKFKAAYKVLNCIIKPLIAIKPFYADVGFPC